MELTENNDVAKVGTALEDASGRSLLKKAQKKRQEREHTLFLDVPSWDGDLVCEYRVVHPDKLKKVAEAAMRRMRNGDQPKPAANDVAMIIAAAVGLYVKDPDTGERVPVEDEFGHVGYDRIAKVLGVEEEIKSNEMAVRYLMAERDDDEEGGWTENVMAMSLHANAIGRWTKDPSKQGIDLEELLGEL
jgi:hypothetical protein